jgi:hypothetical protein
MAKRPDLAEIEIHPPQRAIEVAIAITDHMPVGTSSHNIYVDRGLGKGSQPMLLSGS